MPARFTRRFNWPAFRFRSDYCFYGVSQHFRFLPPVGGQRSANSEIPSFSLRGGAVYIQEDAAFGELPLGWSDQGDSLLSIAAKPCGAGATYQKLRLVGDTFSETLAQSIP